MLRLKPMFLSIALLSRQGDERHRHFLDRQAAVCDDALASGAKACRLIGKSGNTASRAEPAGL